MSEVHGKAEQTSYVLVTGEVPAVVHRQSPTTVLGQPTHRSMEGRSRFFCRTTRLFSGHQVPAGPLHARCDVVAVALADDGVAFPVAHAARHQRLRADGPALLDAGIGRDDDDLDTVADYADHLGLVAERDGLVGEGAALALLDRRSRRVEAEVEARRHVDLVGQFG